MATKKRKDYNLFAWTPVDRRRELSQYLLRFKDPPYSASWIERLNKGVDGLPFPAFLFYIGFSLIPRLTGLVIGVYTVESFFRQDLLFWFIALGGFYYHYLSYGLALDALRNIRRLIDAPEVEYQNIEYRFVILPQSMMRILTLLATFISLTLALMIPSLLNDPRSTIPGYYIVQTLNWGFAMIAGVLFVYRLVYQVFMINSIIKRVKVDLFNLKPVYSLSSYMALESFVFLAITYSCIFASSILVYPYALAGIALVSMFSLVAMACFLFPLLGINRKLVVSKEDLLNKTDNEIRVVFDRFTKMHEKRITKSAGYINQLVNTAIRKREYIHDISTWPWETATFRNLLVGGILPLLLWLLQQGLTSLFN